MRLHRPNLLGIDCPVWRIRMGSRSHRLQPCLPQRGPYEASEGIYPVMGKEKKCGLNMKLIWRIGNAILTIPVTNIERDPL